MPGHRRSEAQRGGGLNDSCVILAVNQVAHAAGLTDYDLLQILGLSFREPERP